MILALTFSAGSVMAQEQQDTETAAPPHQGGWVIEMDARQRPAETGANAPDTQAGSPITPGNAGQGVEMIVGGQGSGGVAKKATLPVVD